MRNDATRLLLLTAVRRDMVLGMKRRELEDLDGNEPRWVIPGGCEGRSKSGRDHVVPLSREALTVIRRRLDVTSGELLFPVTRPAKTGQRPKHGTMTWSSRAVQAIRQATTRQLGARMPRWRIHDLRHTVATHMREDLKISSDVVSLILGHTPLGHEDLRPERTTSRAARRPRRLGLMDCW